MTYSLKNTIKEINKNWLITLFFMYIFMPIIGLIFLSFLCSYSSATFIENESFREVLTGNNPIENFIHLITISISYLGNEEYTFNFYKSIFGVTIFVTFIQGWVYSYDFGTDYFLCSKSRKCFWKNIFIAFFIMNVITTIVLTAVHTLFLSFSLINTLYILLVLNVNTLLGMFVAFIVFRYSSKTSLIFCLGLFSIYIIFKIINFNAFNFVLEFIDSFILISDVMIKPSIFNFIFYAVEAIILFFLTKYLIIKNDFGLYR